MAYEQPKHDEYDDRVINRVESEVKSNGGLIAVIVVIALAIAGYFIYAHQTGQPAVSSTTLSNSASSAVKATKDAAATAVDKTKDVAAEVPQAAKDATTPGDQSTTRPNADGSKKNLDQK